MIDVARTRLRSQRLAGNPLEDPAQAVGWLLAVQAQDYPGAKWGIAQRSAPTTDAAIDALLDQGELIRTHVLRPTWHLVRPRDLRWLLELTAPRVHRAEAARRRQLELDDALLARCRRVIVRELRGGNARTRAELGTLLARHGCATHANRIAHILMHNELDAVICSGPRRGPHQTYVLFDERIPPAPARSREASLAELVVRYFTSHGPATAHDCAWWSGLRVSDIRLGLEAARGALTTETVGGTTWWQAPEARPARSSRPLLHLLPNYDEHVVAYRDHGPSLDPAFATAALGNRLAPHLVALDGLVIGGWRRVRGRGETLVELRLARPLDERQMRALARAATELSRFLEQPVRLREPVP